MKAKISVPTILMAIPIHVLAEAKIGEGDPITLSLIHI